MLDIELIKYFTNKPVKKVYLFGSSLVNEFKANDIDLLLELDSEAKITLFDMGRWMNDLENIFHKKIDLVTTDNINKYIKPSIDNHKKLIFSNPSYA